MNRLVLVLCSLVGTMFGQQPRKMPAPSPSKEYSYPSDGFAMKFPYAPNPHTDSIHPDFKVWTVNLAQRAAISIRLKVDSQPCDFALEKPRSLAKIENVSIKEFSVSGRPAWEEKEHIRGNTMLLERYVCGIGRYYVMTFVWPASDSRPQHIGTKAV